MTPERPGRLRRLSFDRPDWPFDPRRVPFFYGWVVVGAATFGALCSAPGQTIGVSVFTDDLMAATGLSRVHLSLTYLIGTLGGALCLPRAGRIYDRLGARTITVVTAVAFGLTLILLGHIDRIVDGLQSLADARGLTQAVAFAVMAVGFLALRFLGQGVLTVSARNMSVKWFETRRGLSNGVMGVMTSFGFSAAPVLFDALIDAFTWQVAWQILGAGILVGLTAVAALLFRDNPEECGMEPDGGRRDAVSSRPATGPDHTLAQARATLSFWLFLLPMAVASLYGTALPFHIVSIFEHAGLDRDAAITVFLPAAMVAVVVNFFGGWLSDRSSLRWHLALFQLGMMLSNAGILTLHLPVGRFCVIAGSGLMGGMMRLLGTVTWPRYFGRRHLGAIASFAMAGAISAGAMGPTIFGLSLEWLGSYDAASWACIGVLSVLVCLAPLAREPAWPAPPPPGGPGRSTGPDR